jgi:hypothetical protein
MRGEKRRLDAPELALLVLLKLTLDHTDDDLVRNESSSVHDLLGLLAELSTLLDLVAEHVTGSEVADVVLLLDGGGLSTLACEDELGQYGDLRCGKAVCGMKRKSRKVLQLSLSTTASVRLSRTAATVYTAHLDSLQDQTSFQRRIRSAALLSLGKDGEIKRKQRRTGTGRTHKDKTKVLSGSKLRLSAPNSSLDGLLRALGSVLKLVLGVTGGGGSLVLEALDLGLELTDEGLELVEGGRVGHC